MSGSRVSPVAFHRFGVAVPTVLASLSVMIAGCGALAASHNLQEQKETSPPASVPCPDTVPWTGKYVNHSYGFSILIPEHLKGYWNSPGCANGGNDCVCMSDHGRIIPLSPEPYEPERHIEAYAAFAADLDKPTVEQEVSKRLRWIRERSRKDSVEIRRRSSVTLAGLKGQRVVVRYFDNELKDWRVEDLVQLLRDNVEYSLYLRTKEGSYEHDRKVFELVVASFVLVKTRLPAVKAPEGVL